MKYQKDLITVGMPAFNGEKYITKALKSILNQSYRNIELIISDDNSQDKTRQICLLFKRKDHRIKYIRQKTNLGFVKNFNFVLKKAKGKFFMWAGNDDYWDKDYILKLHRLFVRYPRTVLAVAKFNNVYDNRPYNYLKHQEIKNGLRHLDYLVHFLNIRNISYFYGLHKTDNLRRSGGYLADRRPFFKSSDFLTIFKALLGGPLSYVDEVLFFKRDTGDYTNQYKLIEQLRIDFKVIKKIVRFLCFPVYYTYDLISAIRYTLYSSLLLTDKLLLIYYLFVSYLKYNFDYFIKTIKGCISIIKGVLSRF